MKNREIVIAEIKKPSSDMLAKELEYYMEIMEFSYQEYDLASALQDVETFAEESNERKLLKEVRGIFIRSGFYTHQPFKTVALGRDTRFQYDGKMYDFEHGGGGDAWLNSETQNKGKF